MKKTAIIVSVLVVGLVGWLIVMPHTTPSPEVQPDTDIEVSSQPVSSTAASEPLAPPKTSAPHETIKPQPTPAPVVVPADTTTYYTSAQVSMHASTQSCWTIVSGKVYDLTSWINQHPGGANAIKRLCGVDGTEDFNDQHGGQSRPERELAAFFIGVLK